VPKIDDDDDAKVVINTCGSGIALGPVGGMPSRRSYTYVCGRERIVSRVLPPPCSSQSEKEKGEQIRISPVASSPPPFRIKKVDGALGLSGRLDLRSIIRGRILRGVD
jgi:hypothetical protein